MVLWKICTCFQWVGVYYILVDDLGVTNTWTGAWCSPAPHQYHPASRFSNCLITTVSVSFLSSLMSKVLLINVPLFVTLQEHKSPLLHHFFSFSLMKNNNKGTCFILVHIETKLGIAWRTENLRFVWKNSYNEKYANRFSAVPVFLTVQALDSDTATLLSS